NWETFPHLPYDVWGSTWILAVGQQGRLIASGRMKDNKGWPVLASDDRGSSWTLSDDFQGVGIEGIQIKCNQAGDFFAIARKVVRDGGRVGDDLVIRKLAAPGAPRIRLSVEPSTLRLSWPGAFSGFIPQSTASLGSDINWLDLEATPVLEGEKWVVTVDPQTEEARFFRLRKP
ncbi:MAG: hypothetical protein KJ070_20920, partial [Verrucomicrobia bacterium]|nr:hypothetical protein [Verrucomicrobiota bacterium]